MKEKIKVWSTKEADTEFSLYIRKRDKKCMRCGRKTSLTCSHFWSRKRYSTRYDPENNDTLCVGCHIFIWEKEKHGDYRDYMIKKLGQGGYDALRKRAETKVQAKVAILKFMKLLGRA